MTYRVSARKIGGYYRHTNAVDVAIGRNELGEPTVLVQGGEWRQSRGVSFRSRDQVIALHNALGEILDDWDDLQERLP